MSMMKNLSMAVAGAVFMAVGAVSSAQAAILGGQLFSTGGNVQVEILPGNPNAWYTSELRLFSSDMSQFQTIGTSREGGKVVDLGSFATGQELLFGIFVQNTGQTFVMGSAARNADGVVHNVLEEIAPGVVNVGFEDFFGGGDRNYTDVRFQFRRGVDDAPTSVPEPASVLSILALGSVGAGSMLKRKQQQKATQ